MQSYLHFEMNSATLIALGLGALHALEPGHGKTAMFAKMLDPKTTVWRSPILGISTALSHTFSIFIIAALTHALIHLSADYHFQTLARLCLSWVSALALLSTGVYLLYAYKIGRAVHVCGPACSHFPRLARAPVKMTSSRLTFKQEPALRTGSWKIDALLGFGTGLLPCPTLLATYLANLNGGKTMLGVTSVIMFAVGIASALAIVGWVFQILAGRLHARTPSSVTRMWPLAQAVIILICGVYYTTESIAISLH